MIAMAKITKNSAICTQANPILWEFVKEAIYSTLEDSGICLTGHADKTSIPSIMIAFIEPGGNRESAFKLLSALEKASKLTTLPSEELKAIIYTFDLEEEWKWQRYWSLLLSKCFLLLLMGETEGLLEQEKQEKLVTRWDADLIEHSAYRYQALYTLIRRGFKYLRKSSPNDLNNKSPWDIFFEIAREEIDFQFEKYTESFLQLLTDTWIASWEKMADQKVDRDNLALLLETQEFFQSERLLEILAVLIKQAKRDTTLRGRLVAYFNECREFAALIAETLKARDSSGKVTRSEQWKHGERFIFYNNRPLKPCYKT